MADRILHILVTGEEGKGKNFLLRKHLVRNVIIGVGLTITILATASVLGIHYFRENMALKEKVSVITEELNTSTARLSHQLTEAREALDMARTTAKQQSAEYEARIASLASHYEERIASLKEQQENLLKGTISRLDERSKIIEAVMDHIGVKVEVREDPEHSGGPFIKPAPMDSENLILTTDRYLKILQQMPLGVPVPGAISSKFGRRTDPLLKKKAFHSGVDIRGRTGDKVVATGDGIVKKSAYNKGLGHHVIISHGNGYETVFAHLSKRLVKRGEQVTRGQVIGLLGNSGRSTGSHLHYEIRLRGKPINPIKYLEVANLSLTVSK